MYSPNADHLKAKKRSKSTLNKINKKNKVPQTIGKKKKQ